MIKVPAPSQKEKMSRPAVKKSDAKPPVSETAFDATSLDAEAERIAELMEQTARAIFKARKPESKKLKPEALALTLAQMRCLRVLSHEQNCTMRDLSQHLGVRPSTATELVDALVRGGFVQRTPDPNDRRAVRLNLSAKGRRLKDKHRAERQQHLRAVIANLSDEQRHAMLGALETLVGVLKPEHKDCCVRKESAGDKSPR